MAKPKFRRKRIADEGVDPWAMSQIIIDEQIKPSWWKRLITRLRNAVGLGEK